MNAIEQKTKELIEAIISSEDYKRFESCREEVRKNPELRDKINAFRLHVFQVQNSTDSFDHYEEQQKLGREYEEFRRDPLVHDFLRTELHVCRLLQHISLQISEEIDLDAAEFAEKVVI